MDTNKERKLGVKISEVSFLVKTNIYTCMTFTFNRSAAINSNICILLICLKILKQLLEIFIYIYSRKYDFFEIEYFSYVNLVKQK